MEKNFTPAQTGYPPPPSYPGTGYPPVTDYPPPPIVQTNFIAPQPVGPTQSRVICPSCHADVLTTMRHEPTTKTHLIALCLFCCICWPCVCVPYCMDSCQNANHYCPNCNAFIGTYEN